MGNGWSSQTLKRKFKLQSITEISAFADIPSPSLFTVYKTQAQTARALYGNDRGGAPLFDEADSSAGGSGVAGEDMFAGDLEQQEDDSFHLQEGEGQPETPQSPEV